ncbi:Cysteine-rich secretory protein family protein [Enhygromyxa salina]|uniref:Cysteine-rich secretory protein family protein n=2 Tax=Enhygromyxa salina TaxID=215803 RepID=A0A2S9XUE0_9BACT|nr:Cysteine-rich secretory protein family protein [Enhygromyxa salina]
MLSLAVLMNLGGCADDPGADDFGPDDGADAAGADDADGFNAHCEPQADWDPAWAQYESDVLGIVNARRAEGASCGGETFAPTGPMVAEAQLRCAARLHSQDMFVQMYFDHTNLDGESPWDRVDKTDYDGFASGENIAQGYPDPTAVMDGWMNSPGHCANIMNADNTEIGIGFHGGDNHWTQVMGRR